PDHRNESANRISSAVERITDEQQDRPIRNHLIQMNNEKAGLKDHQHQKTHDLYSCQQSHVAPGFPQHRYRVEAGWNSGCRRSCSFWSIHINPPCPLRTSTILLITPPFPSNSCACPASERGILCAISGLIFCCCRRSNKAIKSCRNNAGLSRMSGWML